MVKNDTKNQLERGLNEAIETSTLCVHDASEFFKGSV